MYTLPAVVAGRCEVPGGALCQLALGGVGKETDCTVYTGKTPCLSLVAWQVLGISVRVRKVRKVIVCVHDDVLGK